MRSSRARRPSTEGSTRRPNRGCVASLTDPAGRRPAPTARNRPTTGRGRQAFSSLWNASCSTATTGQPAKPWRTAGSTSSKSSATANAATRPWTTPAPPPTSASTPHQHLLQSYRVHQTGPTPSPQQSSVNLRMLALGSKRLTTIWSDRGEGGWPGGVRSRIENPRHSHGVGQRAPGRAPQRSSRTLCSVEGAGRAARATAHPSARLAGCRAAALVGLRHLQEVADAPGGAIGGQRSPMEIPAVLSFAVLLW